MAECRLNLWVSTPRLVLPFSTTSPRMFTFTWSRSSTQSSRPNEKGRPSESTASTHQTGPGHLAVGQAVWKHQEVLLLLADSQLSGTNEEEEEEEEVNTPTHFHTPDERQSVEQSVRLTVRQVRLI